MIDSVPLAVYLTSRAMFVVIRGCSLEQGLTNDGSACEKDIRLNFPIKFLILWITIILLCVLGFLEEL